jgi:hypothetical protein
VINWNAYFARTLAVGVTCYERIICNMLKIFFCSCPAGVMHNMCGWNNYALE